MKMRSVRAWFLVMLASCAILRADVSPELAALVEKHQADLAALEAQTVAAPAHSRKIYLAELDAADRSAVSSGDIKGAAAISAERSAISGEGDLPLTAPPDLPASLRTPRKMCQTDLARFAADRALRQKRIDADYLRALATLQGQASPNTILAAQVAAEKSAFLKSAAAKEAVGTNAVGTADTSSSPKLMNGDFKEADAAGGPAGWFLGNQEGEPQPAEDGAVFKVVHQSGGSFLNGTFQGKHQLFEQQQVDVPKFAKSLDLRGRVRGKKTEGAIGAMPKVSIHFIKADGSGGDWGEQVFGESAAWKPFDINQTIPPDSKKVRIFLGTEEAGGVFDFQHIELVFH